MVHFKMSPQDIASCVVPGQKIKINVKKFYARCMFRFLGIGIAYSKSFQVGTVIRTSRYV